MLNRHDISEAIRTLVGNDVDYMDIVWSIQEFNLKFEVKPNPSLYANLVVEEVNEFIEELTLNGYSENLLKELVDILYVLEGLLAANTEEILNIDSHLMVKLEEAIDLIHDVIVPITELYFEDDDIMEGFIEVHRSNMSKLGDDGKPVRRESDNKVLKGPNYSPADLSDIIIPKETMVKALKVTGYE